MIKKVLIVMLLSLPATAQAGQGCIKTTSDGKKYCSEIMTSSSCKGPTSSSSPSINGKKVVKAELASLRRDGGFGSPKTCRGNQSREFVKQKR